MWELQEINESGTSFMVLNATVGLARWVVDPALPWVLLERHFPTDLRFTDMALPLSRSSLLHPRLVRASNVTMDLLFRTEEFLDILHEFEEFGLTMWQLDKEPRSNLGLSEKMFHPNVSREQFRAMKREMGVRLGLLVPHKVEDSEVSGPDTRDVRAAWERVQSANAVE